MQADSRPSPDPAEYSSRGVREQTAELASYALAERRSATLSSSTSESPQFRQDSFVRQGQESHFGSDDSRERRSSGDRPRPEVIEETSEPVSPAEDQFKPVAPHADSALTDMIRKQSMLPTESTRRPFARHTSDRPQSPAHPGHFDQDFMSNETTPLLGRASSTSLKSYSTQSLAKPVDIEGQRKDHEEPNVFHQAVWRIRQRIANSTRTLTDSKTWRKDVVFQKAIKEPLSLLPCVFLGLLLNVLDALSYGECASLTLPCGNTKLTCARHDSLSTW